MNLDDYETVKQAALRLGLTYASVSEYIKAGRVPGLIRVLKHPMIPREWVPERRKPGRKRKDAPAGSKVCLQFGTLAECRDPAACERKECGLEVCA